MFTAFSHSSVNLAHGVAYQTEIPISNEGSAAPSEMSIKEQVEALELKVNKIATNLLQKFSANSKMSEALEKAQHAQRKVQNAVSLIDTKPSKALEKAQEAFSMASEAKETARQISRQDVDLEKGEPESDSDDESPIPRIQHQNPISRSSAAVAVFIPCAFYLGARYIDAHVYPNSIDPLVMLSLGMLAAGGTKGLFKSVKDWKERYKYVGALVVAGAVFDRISPVPLAVSSLTQVIFFKTAERTWQRYIAGRPDKM